MRKIHISKLLFRKRVDLVEAKVETNCKINRNNQM